MQDTNDKDFQLDVMKSSTPVLVDFWAPCCSPCKAMMPILSELETEYAGKLKIVKLNTEDNQATMNRFGIRAIPNFLIIKNGKVKFQITGMVAKAQLVKEIEDALK
ncbi:MAG TPA: thioredoxin [Nitrosopumilaceae archaeon]|nr:thioredoxin [Nitrosopumilaceae archaeon]